jgi:hypothetical protein
MLSRIYAFIAITVASALFTFTVTQRYYVEKVERIYAEADAKAKADDLQNLQKQRATEQLQLNVLNSIEDEALTEHDKITFKFNAFATGADPYGLQHQNSSSDSATALSDTPTAALKISESCDCGRFRQTYNRLKRTCGILAKERDEIAVDRNELVRLYNQVRATYGNETENRVQEGERAAALRSKR